MKNSFASVMCADPDHMQKVTALLSALMDSGSCLGQITSGNKKLLLLQLGWASRPLPTTQDTQYAVAQLPRYAMDMSATAPLPLEKPVTLKKLCMWCQERHSQNANPIKSFTPPKLGVWDWDTEAWYVLFVPRIVCVCMYASMHVCICALYMYVCLWLPARTYYAHFLN